MYSSLRSPGANADSIFMESPFWITESPIEPTALKKTLQGAASGAFASFEGWVRNHNEGKQVNALEYSAYKPLAEKEGARIIEEAKEKFAVEAATCVHRVGSLEIGDIAIWVGVSAPHRSASFEACRFIVDEIKARVPIWKREGYQDGLTDWINCPSQELRKPL